MDFIELATMVILVTASGALFPGPLFFALIPIGASSGARAGFVAAIGHSIVEFPLVVLLATGFLAFANQPVVKFGVNILSGVALLAFGILQIRDVIGSRFRPQNLNSRFSNPLVVGLALSALNPFFIMWWMTVGLRLVLDAWLYAAFIGILLMYLLHIWMDYVWLTFVAHTAHRGRSILGIGGYRIVLVVFGVVLIFYGVNALLNIVGSSVL